MTTIEIVMTGEDFGLLCNDTVEWPALLREHRKVNGDTWDNRFNITYPTPTTVDPVDQRPLETWKFGYYMGRDWAPVMFARAFLHARGIACQVVYDDALNDQDVTTGYVVLTDYDLDEPDPEFQHPAFPATEA